MQYFKELLLNQMEELLEKADLSVSEALSVEHRSSDPLDLASDNMNTLSNSESEIGKINSLKKSSLP